MIKALMPKSPDLAIFVLTDDRSITLPVVHAFYMKKCRDLPCTCSYMYIIFTNTTLVCVVPFLYYHPFHFHEIIFMLVINIDSCSKGVLSTPA